MIPELGLLALIIAFCLALAQATIPIVGAAKGNARWMAVAKPTAQGQLFFVFLAFAALTVSFIINDFSVSYVVKNSNTLLPLAYRISAVWGGHEGSLLLWALILALWSFAVTVFSRRLPQAMLARVLAVMGMISVGFLLFMLLTSNPFDRVFPPLAEGNDLNPLLQDPGLIFHPPLLYMGYVGFSVAFAFALAALIGGHLDAAWARWSRPWTTMAWVFLTLGIALGSWWAYYELGWGGWWFWDPVENASFMPWLVGTALIHSLAATEKRGTFKTWTVLLAILAFSLSLLGTFLVRSGVLTSVHTFATDPKRGIFILVFLLVVVGGSLILYAWRAPQIRSKVGFAAFSRETLLLGNNILLIVAMAGVLLGTLYPLILDTLGAGKISVGPPYFNLIFVPLMLPLVVLMGLGPITRWRQDHAKDWLRRLRFALIITTVTTLLLTITLIRSVGIMSVLGLSLAVWVTVNMLITFRNRYMNQRRLGRGFSGIPLSYYGMTLAHIGVAIFIVGITLVGALAEQKDLRMQAGDSYTLAGYRFHLSRVIPIQGPNYSANRGVVHVYKGDKKVADLYPEKRVYHARPSTPMTEAAIDPGLFRDIYVSLGEPLQNGAWSISLYYKPFISWIWLGAFVMAIGGVCAASDRRYRAIRRRRSTLASPELGQATASRNA